MRSEFESKRVSAIIPVNRDCVTFVFKDGTNATLTYRELRDRWNEMTKSPETAAVPKGIEKERLRVATLHSVQVREPVAHSQFPKLHPLAKPRTVTYES